MFYCFSSYSTLLEVHYGGRVTRSRIAQEWAKGMGISIKGTKCQTGIGLFLDEYPQWELGTPTGLWFFMTCFCMLPIEGRRRWNVWSAGATGTAPWDQICRQVRLLWSWWGIRHPVKKFETSIKVFSCYKGYQVFPVVCQSTIDYPACRCWTVKHSTPIETNHIQPYIGHAQLNIKQASPKCI